MILKLLLLAKKNYSQWVFKFFPAYRLRKSGASVGSQVFFGDHVYVELENAKYLTIGNSVVLSAFVKLILHDSSLRNVTGGDIYYGQIILKDHCYIGANTLILPGTTIGKNTIIGAGSLAKGVYKDNSVYAGVPAKYLYSVKRMKVKWNQKTSPSF